jgi:kinesin family protein C2/C3
VLQAWLRKKRETGKAWKQMLDSAKDMAKKAREAKASTNTKAAWKIQRCWRRRKYLNQFRRAVAEYLVKRERMKKLNLKDQNVKSLGAALVIQTFVRGSMVRYTRDDAHYASRRVRQTNMFEEGLTSSLSAAADMASSMASGMASGMSGMLGFTETKPQPTSSKKQPKASPKKLRPPPRLHLRKGRFAHFRTAVLVIQAFARRTIALHRLYSRGCISTTLGWRKQKRRGLHKLSWLRGHKGCVKISGSALRSLTLLGFCKLVAMRRKLYAAECAAVCIQSMWRGYARRLHFAQARRRVTVLQSVARQRRGSRIHKEYKHSMLTFQALAAKRRRRTKFRGVARMVVRLLAIAKRAKKTVADDRHNKARVRIQRFMRVCLCMIKIRKCLVRWKTIKAAVIKLQSRARMISAKIKYRKTRKSAKTIVEFVTRRHRKARMFKSLIEVVRLANKGGGGGSSKDNIAAFRIQTFFKSLKVGPQVNQKVHKRVMKAGLRFKALAEKRKVEQDQAKEEVRELQLELRVMRKHNEESFKAQQERADKMIEQQMAALQNMQSQTSQVADMGAMQAQLDGFREKMVQEMGKNMDSGGGMGGEESKRLYRRIEKQEDELSDARKKVDNLEAQRDDLKKELRSTAKQAKSLANELFDIKKGYMEQRGINSKLMLEVQSLKGNIQVCCRIRPYNKTEIERGDEPAVALITESEIGVLNNGTNDWETYGFDQVWGVDSTQAQVFEQVEALALSVVDGFNACICCYGQTGSGKTFTMTGLPREGKPGISFQTMDKVFEMLQLKKKTAQANQQAMERLEEEAAERRRKLIANGGGEDGKPPPPTGSASKIVAFEWSARVSMLEIYNEEVRCLLAPPPKKNDKDVKKLDIKQGKDGLMTVPGLVSQDVENTEGVLEAFEQGNSTRSVSATAMNATSSRSHMVLMVDVTTRTNDGAAVTGRLYLVDLAGSERVAKSGVTGQAMKEAQGINKSLSALGDVMEALDKRQSHIPFRNSKLTFLLQSALGGSARCMFIFNASPAEGNSDETRCTCKFASRMRNISLGAAKKNVDAGGLEEDLTKAKREARAAISDLNAMKQELDTLRKNQSNSADNGALERAEGMLALKEAESAAAAEEIATLQDQLEDVKRALKEAQTLKSRSLSTDCDSDGESRPVRKSTDSVRNSSEGSSIPRMRLVRSSRDVLDQREGSASRPVSATRARPKSLSRAATADSATMKTAGGRGAGRGSTSSGRGSGVSSADGKPPRTRPSSTGSYSSSAPSKPLTRKKPPSK